MSISTSGVMRAWYNAGTQFVYWRVTQILNPLSEYTAGGAYPATNLLSDFVLMDYSLSFEDAYSDGVDIPLPWGAGVGAEDAVFIDSSGGIPMCTLAQADSINSSDVTGIASDLGFVRTNGLYTVNCTSAADIGDSLFLSATTAGSVTTTAPTTAGQVISKVGVAAGTKAAPGAGVVEINISTREPIELEENITEAGVVEIEPIELEEDMA